MHVTPVGKIIQPYFDFDLLFHNHFCSLQAAMLSSAEFICLGAGYREAFWEELTRLI